MYTILTNWGDQWDVTACDTLEEANREFREGMFTPEEQRFSISFIVEKDKKGIQLATWRLRLARWLLS